MFLYFFACYSAAGVLKLIHLLNEKQIQALFGATEASRQTQTGGSPLDIVTEGKASQFYPDFMDTKSGFKFKHQSGDMTVWTMKAVIPSSANSSKMERVLVVHAIVTGGYGEQLCVAPDKNAFIQSNGETLHACGSVVGG